MRTAFLLLISAILSIACLNSLAEENQQPKLEEVQIEKVELYFTHELTLQFEEVHRHFQSILQEPERYSIPENNREELNAEESWFTHNLITYRDGKPFKAEFREGDRGVTGFHQFVDYSKDELLEAMEQKQLDDFLKLIKDLPDWNWAPGVGIGEFIAKDGSSAEMHTTNSIKSVLLKTEKENIYIPLGIREHFLYWNIEGNEELSSKEGLISGITIIFGKEVEIPPLKK